MLLSYDIEQVTSKMGLDYENNSNDFVINISRDEIVFKVRILRNELLMFIYLLKDSEEIQLKSVEFFAEESNDDKVKELYNYLSKLKKQEFKIEVYKKWFKKSYKIQFFDPELERWEEL